MQILNLILLTAPELSPLRSYLQKKDITHLPIQESQGILDIYFLYYVIIVNYLIRFTPNI